MSDISIELAKKLRLHAEIAVGSLSRVQTLGDMTKFIELLNIFAGDFNKMVDEETKESSNG